MGTEADKVQAEAEAVEAEEVDKNNADGGDECDAAGKPDGGADVVGAGEKAVKIADGEGDGRADGDGNAASEAIEEEALANKVEVDVEAEEEEEEEEEEEQYEDAAKVECSSLSSTITGCGA
jgi:hypothetical protein